MIFAMNENFALNSIALDGYGSLVPFLANYTMAKSVKKLLREDFCGGVCAIDSLKICISVHIKSPHLVGFRRFIS